MSNELVSMQQELKIAQQKNEIMDLKFQLEKLQAQKASRLEDSLFSPTLFPHYQKVAETLSKSGVIPNAYRGKPEDVFVAIAMGYQLGFPVEQSLQDIAVINGRPCLWGDGLLSLVLNHPECKDIVEEPIFTGQTITGFSCTVTRKGHAPHTQAFTIQDAERAGLLKKGGVWSSYPARMLQMRARSLALRDKFADALRGLRIAEIETDDSKIIDVEVTVESAKTQTEKLKRLLKSNPTDKIEYDNGNSSIRESANDNGKKNMESDNIIEGKATQEQIDKINIMMEEKEFDDTRKKKALNYFKVFKLEDLTYSQANTFMLQVEKASSSQNASQG